jgi:predicted HAD superfamily Cof-like phosphohydrolase
MNRNFNQVIEFHKAFGVPIGAGLPTLRPRVSECIQRCSGTIKTLEDYVLFLNTHEYQGFSLNLLRISLMLEEVSEYLHAEAMGSRVRIADSLGDIGVISDGSAITYAIDLPRVRDEIHRANMSKLGPDGRPVRRVDGKILKGPNYKPPNLDVIVKYHMTDIRSAMDNSSDI